MAENGDEGSGEVRLPLVSVVMPAFHSEKTIRKAVESVLEQDIPLELLIYDNSPDEETRRAIQDFLGRPEVFYHRNPVNQGVAASRNLGITQARGKWIAFLDSDDWWAPGKLKIQCELLEKTGLVLCSTAREFVEWDGTPTGRVVHVKERITYRDLLKHNSINCSSVLVRREAAAEFLMEHDDAHEDYILWLRILKKYGEAVGINEPLLFYRKSQGAKTANKWRSAAMHFKSLRYAGIDVIPACFYFVSYALHGVLKHGIRG